MNIKEIFTSNDYLGLTCEIKGWITTSRVQSNLAFIYINDGSCLTSLQIVIEFDDDIDTDNKNKLKELSKSVCISVYGEITKSPAKEQLFELKTDLDNLKIIGTVNPDHFPLAKKAHGLDYVRKYPHLRVRTNTFGMLARIRNTCSFATHTYFQNLKYINVHTPIITSNDCEGAGETFTVTNIDTRINDMIKNNKINYKNDFFEKKAFLTVSGQLHAESYAIGLSKVYTFGPTFRAENSNTSRHLAEFWMVEPEAAFISFDELMNLAENYIKFCIKKVLEDNIDDLEFIDKYIYKGKKEFLENLIESSFKKISYTEVVEILINDYDDKSKFDKIEKWGDDLNSSQEKYITSKYGPTIVYDYPKEIKSFYMKVNKDGKTVQAMDILVPEIGEIIGGSMREENYENLVEVIKNKNINEDNLSWYLDLRRFGSAPHGGFGLGFERLIMLITGLSNIKDCIPFPRYPTSCIN